jgi:hypothetical protein
MWEVHDSHDEILATGFQSQWDALDWMDEQGSNEYMELAYIDNPIK